MSDSTENGIIAKWPEGPVTVNDLAMKAVKLFSDEGQDCETAVISAFDDFLGLRLIDESEPKVRRIGLGFQVPCGALLGATRVLCHVLGPPHDSGRLARELNLAFARKHKASTCQYLTAHIKWGEHHRFCGKYVYTAAELLWETLEPILANRL
ncbi:MAG: C-GCAxxG-C-C family protein [Deltaproteobacteria bacterium]|nr:C-GCAxxG-C-C family protein [Deltaproteobacteria bacterium]